MSDPILLETSDGIALVTLNRPDKLNALNYALIDRLMAVLDAIETDAAVRAVILTGAGERAFSAGADIHEFAGSVRRGRDTAMRDFVRRGQAMTARLEAFRKPVIAAVNGLAFGGGCEITEAVHLAIASERAQFAKPEINLGMPPTFGGTQRLPRLAGRKRALELLLTGDAFSPEQALEIGLVNKVVPHDALLPAARDLAAAHHQAFAARGRRRHHRGDARTEHGHRGRAAGRERAIRRAGAEPRSRRRHRCLDRAPAAGLCRPLTRCFPSRPVRRATTPWLFKRATEPAISYSFGSERRLDLRTISATTRPPGLLIAKDDTILYEHYQYARTDRDRFLSQSMAKTITAMLIGIAVSEGKIKSINDPVSAYVAGLADGGIRQDLNPRPPAHVVRRCLHRRSMTGKDDIAQLSRDLFIEPGQGPCRQRRPVQHAHRYATGNQLALRQRRDRDP